MKYFFLSFVAAVALVIGVFGLRGEKFNRPPIEVFPDMDRQDFVQAQEPNDFFHDGMGARLPVTGTVPHASDDGLFPVEFGEGRTGHYYTGAIDDYFATGLPREELGLEGEDAAANMLALLRRGQDRYEIYCTICHGESGDGGGVVSQYIEGNFAANFHEPRFSSDQYPNGQLFHVITHGLGRMSGYAASIPVRDRWAIVAYVRALQDAKPAAPAPEPAEGGDEAAPAEGGEQDQPAEGEATAEEDEAAPAEEADQTQPAEGEAAPAEEEAAPEGGVAPDDQGDGKPAAGDEAAPAEGQTETDEGTTN